jgi:hypothetical protein
MQTDLTSIGPFSHVPDLAYCTLADEIRGTELGVLFYRQSSVHTYTLHRAVGIPGHTGQQQLSATKGRPFSVYCLMDGLSIALLAI